MSNTSQNATPDQQAPLAVTPDDIRAAAEVIRGAVIVTECDQSRTLGEICGCKLWLKFENLQFTSTFKERGALNRLTALIAGRAAARRDRDVGRQSRAGRGLSRQPARHSRHHRDAGGHADGEGREHPASRRRDRHFRRDAGGGGRVRPRARQGAGSHHDPSLRRSADHRGPGHHRARNASAPCRSSTRWWCRSAAAG